MEPTPNPARASFEDALADQPVTLSRVVDIIGTQLADLRRPAAMAPFFVGMGASHAALAAPIHVLRARGVPAHGAAAGDVPEQCACLGDPYVAVSQSGRSPETLRVLLSVPFAHRLAVVNVVPSPLSEAASTSLWLGGVRDSAVSSVGLTATIVALGMAVDAWTDVLPAPSWRDMGDRVAEVIAGATSIVEHAAEGLGTVTSVDVVGGGASATAAEEGALLIRERDRMPATGMETRTYLHGQMDAARQGGLVILGHEREARLAEQLAGAGVPVLFITEADLSPAGSWVMRLPAVTTCQRVILEVVVLQLLVRDLAARRDVAVDGPAFAREDTKIPGALPT